MVVKARRIGRSPSWRFEATSTRRTRERNAFNTAYHAAAPYLTGHEADHVTAQKIFRETLMREAQGTSASAAQMLEDRRLRESAQRAYQGIIRGEEARDAKQVAAAQTAKQVDKRKGGLEGLFKDIADPFMAAGETVTDVIKGDWGEAKHDLAMTGFESLEALDVGGRHVVRPAIKELTGYDIQAYLDDPDSNPFMQVLLGSLTDPLTYIGPGAVKSVAGHIGLTALANAGRAGRIAGTAGRIGAGLLESPYRATAAGILGGAVGAQAGSWLGGETGELVGGIGGGLTAAIVAGRFATPPGLRHAGNRVIEDPRQLDALTRQFELELGIISDRPQDDLGILDELRRHEPAREGYQPSFAEAIPSRSRLTGVPILWTNRGLTESGRRLQGFAEYVTDPARMRHGMIEPHIVINDELMTAPANTARNLAIQQGVLAHEEAHYIWDTFMTEAQRKQFEAALLGPEPIKLSLHDDIQTRWGVLTGARRADEAFAEAWSSLQAGRKNIYSRHFGAMVDNVVLGLEEQTRDAVLAQRRMMADWMPRVDAINDAFTKRLSAEASPYQVVEADDIEGYWDLIGPDDNLFGFVRREPGGKFHLTSFTGETQEFDRLGQVQQWLKDNEVQLSLYQRTRAVPFKTGLTEDSARNPRTINPNRIKGATASADPSTGSSWAGDVPLSRSRQRLWFHGTMDARTRWDTPDPKFGVGSSTAITQGPGIYLSADPRVSSSYGKRLFAIEFDGNELNLADRAAADTYQDALGGSWFTVRDELATELEQAGFHSAGAAVRAAFDNMEGIRRAGPKMPYIYTRTMYESYAPGRETNYTWRQVLTNALSNAMDGEMRAKGLGNVGQVLQKTGLMGEWAHTLDPNYTGQGHKGVSMMLVHNALAKRGVDAVFHPSEGDGDVLIVLNGDSTRAVADFQSRGAGGGISQLLNEVQASNAGGGVVGATVADLKRAGARLILPSAPRIDVEDIHISPSSTQRNSGEFVLRDRVTGQRLVAGDYAADPRTGKIAVRNFSADTLGEGTSWTTVDSLEDGIEWLKTNTQRYRAELDRVTRRGAPLSMRSWARRNSMPVPDDELIDLVEGRELPPGVTTAGALRALETRLLQQAQDGVGDRFWYQVSGDEIAAAAGRDPERADRLARLAAFTSPQTDVVGQGQFIMRGWERFLREGTMEGAARYPSNDPRLIAASTLGEKEWDEYVIKALNSKSPKTMNFYVDMLEQIKPEKAAYYRANGATSTQDMWMHAAFGYPVSNAKGERKVTINQYRAMHETTAKLAAQLGWEPREVQAAIWSTQLRLAGEIPETALSPHYGDTLEKMAALVSLESVPGRKWGPAGTRRQLLDGYENVPLPRRIKHHSDLMRAFMDDAGGDILAKVFGVLKLGEFDAQGVYEGAINPVTQQWVPVGLRATKDPAMGLAADQAERVSAWHAAKSWLLQQDAAGWHRSFAAPRQSLANGVDVSFSRALGDAELKQFEVLLQESLAQPVPAQFLDPESGRPIRVTGTDADPALNDESWADFMDNGAAIVSGPGNSFRVFRAPVDEDFRVRQTAKSKGSTEPAAMAQANHLFRARVRYALEQFDAENVEATTRPIATDGAYISHNDWGGRTNGEGYLDRVLAIAGPTGRQAMDDIARRISALDASFARKEQLGPYARGSAGSVADAAGGASAPRLSAPVPEDKPTFVGMLPSEIAEILGVDRTNRELMESIRGLDALYWAGTLNPSQKAARDAISARLRQEYAAVNQGRQAVWLVAPGRRAQLYASMEQRLEAMREAGFTEQQMREALPEAFRTHQSGGLQGYVGSPNYRRYMQLERVASNPNADPRMRENARLKLHEMAGLQAMPGQTADDLEGQLARSLEALDPEARASMPAGREDLVLRMPTPGELGFTDELTGEASHVRNWARKAFETMVDVLNLPRALMASFDLSGMGRQGILLGVAHPSGWKAGVAAQLKALKSDRVAQAITDTMHADPMWARAQGAGLYEALWGDAARSIDTVNAREEAYFSRWASKIPGIRASERAYAVGLNQQRFHTFKNIVAAWDESGVQPSAAREKELAKFINAATGRGDIGIFNDAGRLLSAFFFSPRFLISRLQAPAMLLASDPLVRKQAARSLASFVGIGTGVLTMMHLATEAGIIDGNVEWDPRSSEFGKIKIGNTRYDFWAGYQPLARYTAQFLTGKAKYGDSFKDVDQLETAGKFFRGKLSPAAAAAVNLMNHEVAVGDEFEPGAKALPGQLAQFAGSLVMPLLLQETWDAYNEDGLLGAVKTLPSGVGLGTQTYMPASAELDREARRLLADNPDLAQRYPDGVRSYFDLQPAERDRVKREHPDIWRRYVDHSGANTKRADEVRTQVTAYQENLDQQVLSGEINRETWISRVEDLNQEVGIRLSEIYGDEKLTADDLETPLDRYRYVIQESKAASGTDTADWGLINSWLASQPVEDQEYIQRNSGLSGTALGKAYKDMRREYYDIPRYLGYDADEGALIDELYQEVLNNSASREDAAMLAALARVRRGYDAKIVFGARRKIMGMLPENQKRARFREKNPMAAFLGRGTLTREEQRKLERWLSRQSAA